MSKIFVIILSEIVTVCLPQQLAAFQTLSQLLIRIKVEIKNFSFFFF